VPLSRRARRTLARSPRARLTLAVVAIDRSGNHREVRLSRRL
jgi:hypothetical protein